VDADGLLNNNKKLKDQMECALENITKEAVKNFPESRLLTGGSDVRRNLASFNRKWLPMVYDAFDKLNDCPTDTNCMVISFRTFVFAENADDPARLKDFVLDAIKEDATDGTFESLIVSEECKNAR